MVQLSITSIQDGKEEFLEMVEYPTKGQALKAIQCLSGEEKYNLSKDGAVITSPKPGLEILLELTTIEGRGGMLIEPRFDPKSLTPDQLPESPGIVSKVKSLLTVLKGGQDG